MSSEWLPILGRCAPCDKPPKFGVMADLGGETYVYVICRHCPARSFSNTESDLERLKCCDKIYYDFRHKRYVAGQAPVWFVLEVA